MLARDRGTDIMGKFSRLGRSINVHRYWLYTRVRRVTSMLSVSSPRQQAESLWGHFSPSTKWYPEHYGPWISKTVLVQSSLGTSHSHAKLRGKAVPPTGAGIVEHKHGNFSVLAARFIFGNFTVHDIVLNFSVLI